MTSNEDEAAIRALIEGWAKAVHAGDLAAVLADHAADIVMFDVLHPMMASGESRRIKPPGRHSSSGNAKRYSKSSISPSPSARKSPLPTPY